MTTMSKLSTSLLAWALLVAVTATPGPVSADVGAAGNVEIERVLPIKDKENVYSVKMLCGTILADGILPQFPSESADELLSPGSYLTIINVHNPSSKDSLLGIQAVNSDGPAQFAVAAIFLANHEIQLDCINFVIAILAPAPTTEEQARLKLTREFFKGFYVLKSDDEHAVIGVYTYKNVESAP